MTGETHRVGGMLCATAGFVLLKDNNLLLPNCNQFVQLLIIYPFCLYGSVFSDIDHNWDCSPLRDPLSRVINFLLHLLTPLFDRLDSMLSVESKRTNFLYLFSSIFSAKHRSWQTHSDITLIGVLYTLWFILNNTGIQGLSKTDTSILALCLTGFALGIVAHFILDMLTPSGVWCVVGVVLNWLLSVFRNKTVKIFPEKLHIVPSFKIFSTGGAWESLVRVIVRFATVLQVGYIIVYIMYPEVTQFLPFEVSIGG